MSWLAAQPVVEGVGFGRSMDQTRVESRREGGTEMDVEVFLDLSLPPCHATYIFTRKSGIPFELRPMELAPWGEQSQVGSTEGAPRGPGPALSLL